MLPPTGHRRSRPASAPAARKRPTTTLTRRKRKRRSRWALSARRPRRAGSEAVRRANQASTSVADEAMSEADGAGGGQTAPCTARVKVGAGGTAMAGEIKP